MSSKNVLLFRDAGFFRWLSGIGDWPFDRWRKSRVFLEGF
jgi:hypothetical protein